MNQEADVQTPVLEGPQADERFAINPNESRFLFVEVAAQRAKQLRRGALNRLVQPADPGAPATLPPFYKPERMAMEEVRRGFIEYAVGEESIAQPKTGDLS